MSKPLPNPYEPPLRQPKLTAAEAADVKYRDVALFVLLNVVTLGIYWFYLAYQWAKEINGLHNRVKYQPVIVLLVSILTCGLGGLVFECLYAFDIVEATRSRGVAGRLEQLPMWVIVCNSVAMVGALIPFGIVLALPLGILASVLIQVELNKLASLYMVGQN